MSTENLSSKELLGGFEEDYAKVRKLLDEDSKNDPENDPYLSKYKAKDILSNMCDTLKREINSESDIERIRLIALLGSCLSNIGTIHLETEDYAASEKVLDEAVELLTVDAGKPEIVVTLVNVYNNLGILWSNRSEYEKAKTFLASAKQLYADFKATLQVPLSIEQVLSSSGELAVNDLMSLEKAHTLTTYYLAQVFGKLKENVKSSVYCHETLKRQLLYDDYDPIDWALNAATLSQCFAEKNGFTESRHHLAAASAILDKYGQKLLTLDPDMEMNKAKVEMFNHRSADVARCWIKYCIYLMSASKNRLMSDDDESYTANDMSHLRITDDEGIYTEDNKGLKFPSLDVAKYESKVGDNFLLTFTDAKEVFLCSQIWINKAKEYYNLGSLASDYIELMQDCSQSYFHLAFFEEDDDRRARMHKRRAKILEELVSEINPQYYMQACRQLWFELAEVYSEMLDIKLDKWKQTNEKPNEHATKKINMLCDNCCRNCELYLDSMKDKSGVMPTKFEENVIRPVINAYALIGRICMKRIITDKATQYANTLKCYNAFEAVVNLNDSHPDTAATNKQEYALCQEMVKVLAIRVKQLEKAVAGTPDA